MAACFVSHPCDSALTPAMAVNVKEARGSCKNVKTLTEICQSFILKYTHHAVWRQLDPPNPLHHEEFRPHDFLMRVQLPLAREAEEKNPDLFRKNLRNIRDYFSENLVRPVYNSLTEKCVKFVTNHLLQHGDVILQMIFQDDLSRSLVMNAKHIVYRRWSVREERTLQRYLATSSRHLVTIKLPGKADDRLLHSIAANCRVLEELDISHSVVTDTALLDICGVTVIIDTGEQEAGPCVARERGAFCKEKGKFVRAAASRAIRDIKTLCANKEQNKFLQELAQGTSAFQTLRKDFPDIEKMTGPMIKKRKDEDLQQTWRVGNKIYSFHNNGCRRLRLLNIWSTNYPKHMITRSGDMKRDLGLTKEAILAAVILLKALTHLKENYIGDILQLFDFVHEANGELAPGLGLTHFSESRLTMDKLSVVQRLCQSVSSLDISMLNFSFFDPEASASFAGDSMNRFSESSKLLFQFTRLRDLEIQYMDDSEIFLDCIQSSASNLTRLCLNKMISVSFETLSAIKKHCQKLEILDVYVDQVYTFLEQTPVEQAISETSNCIWTSLKSLKLGGLVPTGSLLQYLVYGCPNINVLCYSLYEDSSDSITDDFIEKLFTENPMPGLTAFYCEKSMLSVSTFYFLASNLPALKYVGVLSEWGGLDRAGVLAIKAYVLGNNLNIDIESMQDQYYL